MDREIQLGARRQLHAGVGGIDGGVLADLVRQPEPVAVLQRPVALFPGTERLAAVDAHVVDAEVTEAAQRFRRFPGLVIEQPDLLHLDRLDPAFFGQAGRDRADLVVVVGGDGRDGHHRRGDDEVRRADGPQVGVGPLQRRRHVGHGAARRPGVGPSSERGNLLVGQRDVFLEVLDADVLFDEPGRHLAQCRLVLHRARPGPRVLVRQQRHRRERSRPVAVLAGALQDWGYVLRERDACLRLRMRRSRVQQNAGRQYRCRLHDHDSRRKGADARR